MVRHQKKQKEKDPLTWLHVWSAVAWNKKVYEDMGMTYNISVDKDYTPLGLKYKDKKVEEWKSPRNLEGLVEAIRMK